MIRQKIFCTGYNSCLPNNTRFIFLIFQNLSIENFARLMDICLCVLSISSHKTQSLSSHINTLQKLGFNIN